MQLMEGKEVCVSLKALQDIHEDLFFGKVVHDRSQYWDFYDFYNKSGELACMDGERITVDQVGETALTFRNDNGEHPVYFMLSQKEADAAIFQ